MIPPSEQLLADFARTGAEEAFHELVQRHLPLVYSTALRLTNGDQHLAQDISQTVFTDLARKAAALPPETILPGWLHQHTWFTASKAIRSERRRQSREQETLSMQSHTTPANDTDPAELQSVVDEALTALKPEDRDALVLRYFEQVDLRRIGDVLGVSEDAAQKRVSRALEKLRGVLMARGVTISLATLTSFLGGQSLAAPATLSTTISSTALAAATTGAAVGLSALIGSTKAKLGLAAALAVGVGAPLVWQQQSMTSLRAEISQLSPLLSSNELLRAENAALRNQTLSAADIAEMNRQFLELQRLRGEVTLLRKQAAEATEALARSSKPDATEEETPEPPEILSVAIQTRVMELSHESMAALLQRGFPSVANPQNFDLKVDEETAAQIVRLFEETEGVDIVSAPRISTADGRQARMSITDDLALPGGETLPLGMQVDFLPTIQPDKQSTHLNIELTSTEFLGWENDTQTVPRLRVRNVEHQNSIGAGEWLLLGRSVLLGEGESQQLKLQIYCISSSVINSRGEPVALHQ